ncbi:hypothetical protein [Halarcobacter ebronensis]|uniref:Uncharacterized protein n=1 Tax=Halarcobacter ebronensis TaxID=1462615 RepID=A0A4Q1AUF5_9BACT|nr:hypothetical protein [Halarcobacter ebronensis]QKF83522.1 hypothetical protein AEBR_3076 [Halarcobacter ebronensis]RXK08315.1 hypothetical protein CRV07_00480 [Halarcobacter ebronensis]
MSFLYMFLSAFLENFLYKEINRQTNRNFQSSLMFLISAPILFTMYLFIYGFNIDDFSFLYEWKFYLLSLLELLVFYLYRENYHQNSNNYTMINMFVFSTIYLMPLLAFFYNPIFNFNSSLDVKYDSFLEALIFSITLFVLTLIYYVGKIKNKEIKNLKLLILLLFILLNTMYFSVKTVQTYNGFLVYTFIQILIGFNFLVLSKKEEKSIELKRFFLYFLWPFIYLLFFLAASLIAVEFIAIFKRVSQLISAMILDKKVIKKDAILIVSIIFVTVIFYFYKV